MTKIRENINRPFPKIVVDVADLEYHLITKSNEYGNLLDREINGVHKFVRDIYVKTFSELESIVLNPIDYVRTVKII